MKKVLSVSLSVLFIFSAFSFASSALTESTGYYESERIELIRYDPNTVVPEGSGDSNSFYAIPYFANGADSLYLFYSFLTVNQKAVYNTIKGNPLQSTYAITLTEPITGTSTTSTIPDSMKEQLSAAAIGGISAVCEDDPTLFWFGRLNYSFSYSMQYDGSQYKFTISSFTISDVIDTDKYADLSVVTADYNDMNTVIDGVDVDGATRYEQIKKIHDYIANRVVYDPNLGVTGENPTDHEPTSVFLSPYTTVCEGYAEAFKILCNKAGIPCVVVRGTSNGGGHAWNYVKMDDDKWYGIDCTWDDQGSIYYDFFLVGSETVNTYFDGGTFSSSHTPTGKMFSSTLFTLTYPDFNSTAYSTIVLNKNSQASLTASNLFISKGNTVPAQIYVPTGYTYSYTGNKTGSVITVKNSSGATDSTYTIIMWGDVVPSATVDSSDYNAVVNASLDPSAVIASGTSEYTAADINGDGVIDLFDASEIDLIIAGKA